MDTIVILLFIIFLVVSWLALRIITNKLISIPFLLLTLYLIVLTPMNRPDSIYLLEVLLTNILFCFLCLGLVFLIMTTIVFLLDNKK